MVGEKPYYYNAKTREAAWKKPEKVTIIMQVEFEAIAASGQDPVMVISGMLYCTLQYAQKYYCLVADYLSIVYFVAFQ